MSDMATAQYPRDANEGGIDPGAPTSLADRAYREIQDRLIWLKIRPGAPINEEELCLALGLSRTPVREALKRLEHERLVVAYPRRGTFATEINVTDLTHISEVREAIEPAGARAAARHATVTDHGRFRALLEALRTAAGQAPAWSAETGPTETGPTETGQTGESGSLMALDMRVHRAVYAATHNPYLQDTLIRYDNLATRIWCLFLDRLPGMTTHVGEHADLLRALLAGDSGAAAGIARRHVTAFDQAIRAVL
ncbi:MAG: GntR family transcriptional regulator [Streptosporangiaceae bacterium]